MTTPTFNKFKSTTIYGAFNNADYEDNSVQSSANIQRNLTVGGNIYGTKLFYNGSDISSIFAPTLMPNFLSSINVGVTDPLLTNYNLTIGNASGTITMNTYNGVYPIKINASNLQLSKNNGTNYYDVLTTNTGALKSGVTFTGNVLGLTAVSTDNSTKFATTAFVKNQNYLTSVPTIDLTSYALLSGATFTGTVNCNNGLTTTVGTDVHISCNNTFPTTNSGSKQGLGFFWNKSGGIGETNLLCYGQGGGGGLSIWASNTTNAPSKLAEFYTMGAAFSTSVQGITPATSENSTLFATTAFVKNQNYLTSASLSSSYALLSGATFTGNVYGLTATTTDNSYLLATTAFVKNQNYLTSASLSSYALSSSLSNYALSSSLSNYALSSSLNNYALSSSLSNYALSSSLSNYALSSTLSNYALLSGATFTGIVNCRNKLGIIEPSSINSAVLSFTTYDGNERASIYSSIDDAVFKFSIQSFYNPNGFQWVINGGQTVLMTLDLLGNLTINGKLTTNNSTPIYSTITVPTSTTLDNFQGNYYTTYTRRPTNSVTTLNGVSTVNIGLPSIGTAPNFYPISISQVYFALGTVANPDVPQNTSYCVISPSYGPTPTNTTTYFNINMYNANNGTPVRGYGTLLKSYSTNLYSIIFVATYNGFDLNTPYIYDPFQFTYN